MRNADGRVALAGASAFFAIAIAFGPAMDIWRAFGVPALEPTFADARVITSAWECAARGYDVLASNPCDPWDRPMNYPRIWTLPAVLGLGQSSTEIIGVLFALILLAAVLAFIGPVHLGAAAVYGLALASPAVLTAVERGNNDLVIFGLVVVGLLALDHRPAAGFAWLLLAAILKLYPAILLVALAQRGKRWALACLAAFGAYVVATADDLFLIADGTPQGIGFSYGRLPSIFFLGEGGALLCVAAGVALALPLRITRVAMREEDSFLASAAIYVGTFILGTAWVYRLVFLLLALPLALSWVRKLESRGTGLLVLAAVLGLTLASGATAVAGPGLHAFQPLAAGSAGLFGCLGLRLFLARERTPEPEVLRSTGVL